MTTAFKLGTVVKDAVTGLKQINALVTQAQYMTLESVVGTDYQVPAGKTFYMTRVMFATTSADSGIQIGYGTAGVPSQAGAPAGAVICTANFHSKVSYTPVTYDLLIPCPENTYPFVYALISVASVQIFGIEV